MTSFDFEPILVQEDIVRVTDTITLTWIGKHDPISVSISSNFIEQPNFFCTSILRALFASFVDALVGLATQSKPQIKIKLLECETSVKSKLSQISSALNQRRCREEKLLEFEDGCNAEEEEQQDIWTQSLQSKNSQILICRITWEDIAMLFQFLAPTAQNVTSFQ